jgi:putative tryptophan/tyrosine transport system substrate-binding protein
MKVRRGNGLAIATLAVFLLLIAIGPLRSGFAVAQGLAPGANKPARIGVLLYGSKAQYAPAEHPFFAGLRDLGLVEGGNVIVLVREAEGRPDRLPQLAAELVAEKPDVIVSAGPQPIEAVKNATATIPIVMAIVSDPVTYGFVASLPHPGGNLTGLSMVNTELSSKRIELLKEIAPGITRIAVFTDPTMGPQGLPETAAAARTLGLELQVLELTGAEIERGFAEAERGQAQALLVMPTPFYNMPDVRRRIGTLALQHRLPSMCEEVSYVRDGCLLSYGPDFTAMWRRSATYIIKILQGAKPAELPVEQPTKFNFFINLQTAKALGLTVPPILLAMADEVIE